MNDAFDQLERQLRRAVRSRRSARPAWVSRGHRRTWALVAVGTLLVCGGALAAGGVIHIGAPAEPETAPSNAQRYGGLVKGTVRLLPVATPDPVSGPAWGMRMLSTRSGEGCVQVGRLVDGKLGAIGQDDAFDDDGLFHEFALDSQWAESACELLDGDGRLFVNATVGDIPASAWTGPGQTGCVPSTATRAERLPAPFPPGTKAKPRAICPQEDERDLYYGLLGPDAKSITYRLGGVTHTQPTVGPEGAYLLVTTASPTQLFDFANGGTQDVVPVDGPITELHYRDGRTCHLTARSWIEGKDACTPALKEPVGWAPWNEPLPTAAQVRAPVHASVVRTGEGRYEIAISFKAPVAVRNTRRSYWIEYHQPGFPPQVNGYLKARPAIVFGDGSVEAPAIAAGETITARAGRFGHPLAPGVTTGTVSLSDSTGPNSQEDHELVVGRFAVPIP